MALTKITTSVIAANTLATSNIADNSIDATKIASNSILTRHIDDDQITGDQLADSVSIVTDLSVGNDLAVTGNTTITGNLTVNGSTVTNSASNTTIEDALIELGTGTSGSPSTDAGIVIERGSSDNVFIGWDESADKVTVGTGSFTGASSGNLSITPAAFVSGALTASGLAYPTSDGSANQVIQTDGSGNLTFGDKQSSTQVDTYATSGDGSTTAFDTGTNPLDEKNTWVFIDGVYQQKSTYSYSGTTITFGTAPDNGAAIDVITGTTNGMTSSDTVLGVYEATTTATATYNTGLSASNENNTWVFVGGVLQPKDSYTFSGGTLTFDAATPAGEKLSVTATRALTAGSVVTASMGANAVTSAKIASNSILSRHIANNSIVGADISATTGIIAATFTGALTGNVTGNVTGNITGNVLTAAQTNITSVGTLSALTVSGQLTAGGLSYPTSDGSNGQVLTTNGSGTLSFTTISAGVAGISSSADATAITINSSEQVGIGTSSPDVDLEIATSASDMGVDLKLNGNKSSNGAVGSIIFENASDSVAMIRASRVGGNNDAADMQFFTQATGGSNSERMRIDSSGNVMIGTTSNDSLFHIESASSTAITIQAGTNSSASLRLKNDAHDWDVNCQTNDNFAIYSHTLSAETLVVNASTGNVGINISAPTSKFYVDGGTFAGYVTNFYNAGSGGSNHGMYMETQSTSSYLGIWRTGGTTRFYVDGSGNYYFSGSNQSDKNKKENISDITDNALDLITQLVPKKYNFIGSDIDRAGFIAQDMEAVIPRLVSGNEFDPNASDDIETNPTGKGIDYMGYTAYLTKAIKEQQTIINDLKSRIETLENN